MARIGTIKLPAFTF